LDQLNASNQKVVPEMEPLLAPNPITRLGASSVSQLGLGHEEC